MIPESPLLGMVVAKPSTISSAPDGLDLPEKNREALGDSFSRLCDRLLTLTEHAARHPNIDKVTMATVNGCIAEARKHFREGMR